MDKTANLGLNLPEKGFRDWDVPVNENFNLIDDILSKQVDYGNITNCITEIPQDIKLELNSGVLTLKAGSKIYKPNGFEADGVTKKFEEYVVKTNRQYTSPVTYEVALVFFISGYEGFTAISANVVSSGSTIPATGAFYNTDTNIVSFYRASALEWTDGTLPIAVVKTSATGELASIEHIFNGFGYIGSMVFALPGVKGLIPNGRNVDGSLKNTEFTIPSVNVYTSPTYHTFSNYGWVWQRGNIAPYDLTKYEYRESENYNYELYNNVVTPSTILAYGSVNAGVITSFSPKLPFKAADHNDSSWIAQQAMPSGKYVDLTLGASGSTYIAPANGYFVFGKRTTATGQDVLLGIGNNIRIKASQPNSGQTAECFLPVKKGVNVYASYSAGGETTIFRFIYAEGEN